MARTARQACSTGGCYHSPPRSQTKTSLPGGRLHPSYAASSASRSSSSRVSVSASCGHAGRGAQSTEACKVNRGPPPGWPFGPPGPAKQTEGELPIGRLKFLPAQESRQHLSAPAPPRSLLTRPCHPSLNPALAHLQAPHPLPTSHPFHRPHTPTRHPPAGPARAARCARPRRPPPRPAAAAPTPARPPTASSHGAPPRPQAPAGATPHPPSWHITQRHRCRGRCCRRHCRFV